MQTAWARGASRARGDLATAWALRPVRVGLLGTVLVTLGSLTPAYLPQNSPWWRPLRWLSLDGTAVKVVGTLFVLAGLALLVEGWFRLRGEVYESVKHWAVLALWSLPFLLAPPIFSHDAYSYAAQGWLIHNDVNPYEQGPGVLPGAFADQVAWVWRYTPAPYGPLSLQLQHLLVQVCGLDPYWSAVSMRLPALAGVVLIVVFLPRLARLMGFPAQPVAWFATINPLLVIDFVGGAHNDALMMGLVVLALWLAARGQWVVGAVVVGVAAAIKQPAFLAAYALPLLTHPFAGWRRRPIARGTGRILVSCLLAIATFSGLSWATGLGFGWLNAVNVPGLVVTVSPFTVLGQGLQWLLDLGALDPTGHAAIRYSRAVGLALSVVTVLGLAVTVARRRPLTFLSWGYLAVAFFGPALHSWYVLWGGLLLPLTDPSRRVLRAAIWATMVLLCYGAVNLAWRNGLLALGVAALAGFYWQIRAHERKHDASESGVPVG